MKTIQKLQPRHRERANKPMPYNTMKTTHGETGRNDEELERFQDAVGQLLQSSQTIAMLETLMQG